jgi:hypothetical protein
MSAVVVEIGADATAFQKAVDGLPARMKAASGQMAGAMQKAAGSGNRAMGQMAMQVQDVVVQLQMGTKWTTVMAQQGSQMLSAFGAGGAIAGGFIAIGGAAYQMGSQAIEAFEAAQKASAQFESTLMSLLVVSSPDQLVDEWKGFSKVIEDTNRRINGGMSMMEAASDLLATMSPDISAQDLLDQRAKTRADAEQAIASIETRLVQLSQQQATLAELRAAGRKEEADEMERQLKLAQEIAKVQNLGLSAPTTQSLVSNLQRQYAPPSTAQGNLLENVIGSFRRIMPDVLGPVSDVIQSQLNEQSRKLSAQASALQSVAFGGMKGDVDTSYGRGTSINPLNNGASRMIAELVKQSAVLQQQARSMDKGNAYLSEIEKAVKKFNLSYQ